MYVLKMGFKSKPTLFKFSFISEVKIKLLNLYPI